MFDTRNLTDIPAFMGELIPDQYWSLTAVINYAYAKKYGYRFSFVHLDEDNLLPEYNVAWHRVFYFNQRLAELSQGSTGASCVWLVYVDTDAFFRGYDTSLPEFIGRMASTYHIQDDVGAIFAQEQVDPPMMPYTWHAINAGVYLVRSDEQSRHLFDTWKSAAQDDEELKKKWPAEQGVLTELYFPGKYYTKLGKQHAQLRNHGDIKEAVALVNMTEMNSPWGRFIEHIWSGPGYQKRDHDYTAMLARIDDAEPERFQHMLNEVREHIVNWTPTPSKA
eukprot:TRINITY_DN26901_c1_g2_i2.p1 TRINITY_DN26901_c1_g2~~TRINITY_DN26901_c1_g2_i2.p1  ORF type:complete len:278 (-),score=51.14 TRINITY_DN26901_c1_g2_i2:9-842(-)